MLASWSLIDNDGKLNYNNSLLQHKTYAFKRNDCFAQCFLTTVMMSQ